MYPTEQQAAVMRSHCEHARLVWNLGLEQRGYWKRELGNISVYDQQKSLTEARGAVDWLRDGSAVIQQQALRDLDQAFQNWWKNPGHFGHPTWRRYGVHEGFAIRDLLLKKISKRWIETLVPKVGWVRVRLSRGFQQLQDCKSARVKLDSSGRWHVSFTTKGAPDFEREPTGNSVGLDMGIAHAVTTSDGEHLDMEPLLSPGERRRRLTLQRKFARQNKGSNRRERTRIKLAKVSCREVDRRKDWIEKVTTDLVRRYDFIAIEDLKIFNMSKSAKGTLALPGKNVARKRGLNRSIQSQAWGLFRKRLEDKAGAAVDSEGTPQPVIVVRVNPAYTSQRCNVCGHTDKKNRESQAFFNCQSCGHTSNADVNAALNILGQGMPSKDVEGQVVPMKRQPFKGRHKMPSGRHHTNGWNVW